MAEARGAGGTPGGVGQFVIGLVMAVAGAYLLTIAYKGEPGPYGFKPEEVESWLAERFAS